MAEKICQALSSHHCCQKKGIDGGVPTKDEVFKFLARDTTGTVPSMAQLGNHATHSNT